MSAGNAAAAFSDLQRQTFWLADDEVNQPGLARRLQDGLISEVRQAEQQVVTQGAAEQSHILWQIADHLSLQGRREQRQIHSAQENLALVRSIETRRQFEQGALTGTDGAQDADFFAGLDAELIDFQRQLVSHAIGKSRALETITSLQRLRNERLRFFIQLAGQGDDFVEFVEGRPSVRPLHHDARQLRNGSHDATADDGTGEQPAHGQAIFRHQPCAESNQRYVTQLLERGGKIHGQDAIAFDVQIGFTDFLHQQIPA